ncbi:NAD(P)H-binding protein [Actinosynnema sp. NPDC020468]|uniref:SDR family oxidoreductase n=1 Tax=Actinosynnema sp. NPDC020468 TaxID=3154488 RepID=UPI0033DC9610
MTTVVTGATGHVGRLVVERLVEAGERVRAVTRDPDVARLPAGVEVVRADLAEPASVAAALENAERLYLFPVARTAREVVASAATAGVRRVVVLSSGAVTSGHDTTFHLPVERAVEESGLEWTHVRPGEFALNALHLWGPSIRARRVVLDPYPDQSGFPVHEADIADLAATALLEDGHHGVAYTLVGPHRISHREQVRAIADAIGHDITLNQVTADEALAHYRAQGGWAAAGAEFLFGFHTYDGAPMSADPPTAPAPSTARQATAEPTRTFAEWARDHADDFA